METKSVTNNLRIMADTLEKLQLGNIISCEICDNKMSIHLDNLKSIGYEGVWVERHTFTYPWEKSFYYNDIRFYSLYTQKEYEKEKAA